MGKALYGFMGEPRASMLLKQVGDLKNRVRELERMLAAAEAEVIALRASVDDRHTSVALEEEPALA